MCYDKKKENASVIPSNCLDLSETAKSIVLMLSTTGRKQLYKCQIGMSQLIKPCHLQPK